MKKATPAKRAPRKVAPAKSTHAATPAAPVVPEAPSEPVAPPPGTTTPETSSAEVTTPATPTSEPTVQATQAVPTVQAVPTAQAVTSHAETATPAETPSAEVTGQPDVPTSATAPQTETPDAQPEPPTTDITRPAPAAPAHPDPWTDLLADPAHAPETLARAAVEIIGPRAQAWAAHTRAAYPAATNADLARLASRQFVRFGGLAGLFGSVAGSYAPAALLGGTALTHAQLVLHVAAAHGLDPAHPDRVPELLTIARMDDRSWHLARILAVQTAAWAAVRLVNRRFPGTSVLTAVLAGTTTARSTAARADAFYRKLTAAS